MQVAREGKTEARSHDGVQFVRASEAVGAEILSVDLRADLDPSTFAAVHRIWVDHGVVLFRNQHLSDPDLVRFSRRFGDLDMAPLEKSGRPIVEGCPEILVISNVIEKGKPIGALGNAESVWHTDMSYVEQPPKGSALYALEVPPSGGDTGFLSMYVALEEMPADLRRRIEGHSIKHDSTHDSAGNLRQGMPEVTDVSTSPGAVHPIIRTHPETGRKALFLGRRRYAYIPGLSVEDSEQLLDELWAHVQQERFTWHHKWRVGDLLLWDNRCVMHRRDEFDPDTRRVMHRTQIKGDRPV